MSQKIRDNKYKIVFILVFALFACQKEDENVFPEGAIKLFPEGFSDVDGNKTSVHNDSVFWVNGDTVRLNGIKYRVNVDNGVAYVSADSLTSVAKVYGYYACGNTITGEKTTSPTVVVPARYTCCMSSSRQVINLPMAAYNSSASNAIKFKHITAAIQVLIWNNIGEPTLYVDSVIVKTNTHRINGSVALNLTSNNLGLAASYGSSSSADKMVTVIFPTPLEVSSGEANAKSVQVPVLPISGDELTIEVRCHSTAYDYKYSKTLSGVSNQVTLARNQMINARVKVDPSNETTTNVSVVRTINSTDADQRITLGNRQILSGTGSGYVEVSIPDGATVTLRNLTIYDTAYSPIVCSGNATIIIDGNVNLKGGKHSLGDTYDYTGIEIGLPGTTVTIKGTGNLTINNAGRRKAPAIGSAYSSSHTYGSLVIAGGTINVTGGNSAAAIGTGACNMENITITNDVISLTATAGSGSARSIGASGYGGLVGTITVGGTNYSDGISTSPYTFTPTH